MIVEQIWTGNAYRNFNYLIVCPESGEAMAVDPLDVNKCLDAAKKNGWTITQILNTHEHGDHTGGNRAMIAATRAKLWRTRMPERTFREWTAALVPVTSSRLEKRWNWSLSIHPVTP